jgi:hypothetical protein
VTPHGTPQASTNVPSAWKDVSSSRLTESILAHSKSLLSAWYDIVGLATIVAAVAAVLLSFHAATVGTVIPYNDGSHHVSNVANLAASIRANGLGAVLDLAQRDTADFLTYAVLAIPTIAVGDGRFAFGVGWVLCLITLATALATVTGRLRGRWVRTFALCLVLSAGLFQSPIGGAADTRVDLFSVTLSTLSLLASVQGLLLASVLLGIVAAFAKGAAISLLTPLLACGLLLGFFHVRQRRFSIAGGVGSLLAVALGLLFAARVGPQTVSYNLMATGGSTLPERVQLFLRNAGTYLMSDFRFYALDLLIHYHAWILVVAPGIVIVAEVVHHRPVPNARLALFASVALVYTYVLLTISPLHSEVLTIWFLPSLTLFAAFLARTVPAILEGKGTLMASLALLVFGFGSMRLKPDDYDPPFAPYVSSVFEQADAVAKTLDERLGRQPATVLLMVNFLSAEGPLVHNYDAYRVLIDERLPRSQMTLDGWELGTYGPDWKAELRAWLVYSNIVFLLQEDPMGVPDANAPQQSGRAVWAALQKFRSQHPTCFMPAAPPIALPHVGRREAWLLSSDTDCRQALSMI